MMNSAPASEYYKWGAVARFQETFDLDAPDFAEKVSVYRNVMGRANKIGKWLNDAIAEFKPY